MARIVWNALFGSAIVDALVAGFAALAVAFVAWAMPNDIFASMVSASGLAAIVPAAAPPLGETARLMTIVAAAAGIFLLLFGLLRLVSYRPARRRAARTTPLAPMVPRVRRADAHPDAPSRAPISAMFELGTPIPPPWPEPEVDAHLPDPTPWSEPEVDAYPSDTSAWLAARRDKMDKVDATYPSTFPAANDEDVLILSEPFAPFEPEPASALEPPHPPEPVREDRPPVRGNESLAELMLRLERGLVKMGGEAPAEPPAAPDERLRSAIEDLQRLAAQR